MYGFYYHRSKQCIWEAHTGSETSVLGISRQLAGIYSPAARCICVWFMEFAYTWYDLYFWWTQQCYFHSAECLQAHPCSLCSRCLSMLRSGSSTAAQWMVHSATWGKSSGGSGRSLEQTSHPHCSNTTDCSDSLAAVCFYLHFRGIIGYALLSVFISILFF